jgi:diguanylate cyclase (GGDEF)-like protein
MPIEHRPIHAPLRPAAAAMAAALATAYALGDAGRADDALALAQSTRADAEAAGDDAARGEALLCEASLELRLLGRFVRALEQAQHATLRFQHIGDIGGECRALAVHAIASTRLGHHEKAMESALLAARLSETLPSGRERVTAYHALGIAAFSGRNFIEAGNAYQQAIQSALQCEPPLPTFELHVDLASTEALRYCVERIGGGARLSLDALERHVTHCHRLLAQASGPISLAPASDANNRLVLALSHVHLLAWQHQFDAARAALRDFDAEQRRSGRPWMRATVHWAETELALAEGRLADAEAAARAMVEVASHQRHEGLVSIGYQVLSHVCEQRGDLTAALQALRAASQREQAARAESLKTRVQVIEWQLELRQNQQRLQRLESDSRLFQRLAMEDSLTGLANRRQFEAVLTAALQAIDDGAEAAEPLCLVMIDADRFKQINDGYSHNVGDAVLQRIAQELSAHLRAGDLAARLAGDEFVVILRELDAGGATAVCSRLRQAVREADWGVLGAGLAVSVSLGVAQARRGDTLAGLMERADAAMYGAKRAA